MTHHEWQNVQEATRMVRSRWSGSPTVGIVLGTGLGALAREIDPEASIAYPDIPHFPKSTVESHKGQLVCGKLAGKSVIAMEGRFHLYEGYSPSQVTFPIRVMKELGCGLLIVRTRSSICNSPCFSATYLRIKSNCFSSCSTASVGFKAALDTPPKIKASSGEISSWQVPLIVAIACGGKYS